MKTAIKTTAIAGLALLTSACATTYGEIGFWGEGVAADPISSDTFRIRSRGNGATEHATIEDYAMLRAAEAVKSACFTHFVVLDGADRTTVDEDVTPAHWTKTVVEKEVDGKKVKTVDRTYHPETRSITIRPGQDLVVRGLALRQGEPAPEEAISADEIIWHVGPRVERRKNAPPPVFPDCGSVTAGSGAAAHARVGG
ncbi:MAG TPA: hypothetical protein VF699_07410 [Caulobacteraceae bacterium]